MINALREMTGSNIRDKKCWMKSRHNYAKKIKEKAIKRREITNAVEEFLKSGGKITLCPPE